MSDYYGPWIENLYIDRYLDKPLSHFNGMIPLFVQWTDIHVYSFSRNATNHSHYKNLYDSMEKHFKSFLRHDVIYVTVCQDAQGW